MKSHPAILPGLPAELILKCYVDAPGNEIESGKFASPESSAALAANAFGYFMDKPESFPSIPELPDCRWPALRVQPEAIVRFPWAGGHHPCLDTLIETANSLIGVESKRYEPFRHKAATSWSEAYWRPVWGTAMGRYEALRDMLRQGGPFQMLDAGQLIKHAFGLRSTVNHGGGHKGKRPFLFYVYAEPMRWPDGRFISEDEKLRHRDEVAHFAELVAGDEVTFAASSYQSLFGRWSRDDDKNVSAHADLMRTHFDI